MKRRIERISADSPEGETAPPGFLRTRKNLKDCPEPANRADGPQKPTGDHRSHLRSIPSVARYLAEWRRGAAR